MRFQKWQALGNDYIIIERDALPFALTPPRIQRICDYHLGIGGDGILHLEPADEPGFVARLRIFNPDGSEAELSGNGAREAVMYLHAAGWTDQRQFSIQTAAGEIRPTIHDDRTCTLDMGRARLTSGDYPGGADDGLGELTTEDGTTWRFQHVQVGNPQCAIHVPDADALEALQLDRVGPGIEHHAAFPNRTNVSFFRALAPDRVRARIFERGVGETSASGTGASGAAIAHVLRGGDTPVTVVLDGGELRVDVDESLLFTLTGWAVPVYAGEASAALLADLEALA
ncbi:MAG TPA: diaminopimelate epimerase [Baekduia sp.]|uniref:diaminopimelate epimerase n=1 Tax=Baekduia sp. TaxID=2600305 RepID=UPI002D79DEE6|nr:diaminopimelate epimerase [Baekduia sp.]HET6509271.1 diaminopimelate epimerase [Baekduia sp.]